MKKKSSRYFSDMVYSNNIMLIFISLFILIILTIGLLNHAKADSHNNYQKSFISIEIQTGDTLTSIAREYAISSDYYTEYIDEVKAINNLKNDTIHSGCFLIVPVYE